MIPGRGTGRLVIAANMPGSYEPPWLRTITPRRLAALIMATR
jgi:hypothetical protein